MLKLAEIFKTKLVGLRIMFSIIQSQRVNYLNFFCSDLLSRLPGCLACVDKSFAEFIVSFSSQYEEKNEIIRLAPVDSALKELFELKVRIFAPLDSCFSAKYRAIVKTTGRACTTKDRREIDGYAYNGFKDDYQ